MTLKEYKAGTAFTGVIGRTFDVSSPAWPEPLRANVGAPNILFIVQDDKLHYVSNYVGDQFFHVESNVSVPEGHHALRFEFEVTGNPNIKNDKSAPGPGQLYIDSKLVGQVDIPLTMPLSIGLGGGIGCGADMGSPVWDKYQPPFRFTGKLHGTIVDVSGDLIQDTDAEMRMVMARQ